MPRIANSDEGPVVVATEVLEIIPEGGLFKHIIPDLACLNF